MAQYDSLFDVSGQNVVITGGAGGLGSAIASGFVARGARVIITSRTAEKGAAAAAKIGEGCTPMVLDVESGDSITAFCTSLRSVVDRVHTLVNAAGGNRPDATVAPDKSPFGLAPEAVEAVFRANCLGLIAVQNAMADLFLTGDHSVSIINVGSMSGLVALSRVGAYSAAKAALHNMTEWYAQETARRYGGRIRVNAIAPGFFPADQNMKLLYEDEARTKLTARGHSIVTHTPMGRFGKAEELVGACVFLASPRASGFITGQVLPIDGGFISNTI